MSVNLRRHLAGLLQMVYVGVPAVGLLGMIHEIKIHNCIVNDTASLWNGCSGMAASVYLWHVQELEMMGWSFTEAGSLHWLPAEYKWWFSNHSGIMCPSSYIMEFFCPMHLELHKASLGWCSAAAAAELCCIFCGYLCLWSSCYSDQNDGPRICPGSNSSCH